MDTVDSVRESRWGRAFFDNFPAMSREEGGGRFGKAGPLVGSSSSLELELELEESESVELELLSSGRICLKRKKLR